MGAGPSPEIVELAIERAWDGSIPYSSLFKA